MNTRLILALALAMLLGGGGAALWAQVKMTVAQLRGFVQSSVKLGHQDKRIADYLKKVKLSERLDASTVEDMEGLGAGPRTVEALRELSEASKALEAPKVSEVKPAPVVRLDPPSNEEQVRVLREATEYALSYTKGLPNFICTQVTRRYMDPAGLEFWQLMDTLTARLSFFEQREDYKVVLVNNQYVGTGAQMEDLGGTTSRGEFGTLLKEIFEPASQARFEWERWATLRGKRMHVYRYEVAQVNSKWRIEYERRLTIVAAYRGLIYVDRETSAVMRVTLEAIDMPPTFPVQQAGTTLDYDYVQIAEQQFVLPLKATIRMRSGKMLTKNDVEFRMYKRYGSEVSITYTPDPIAEDQTKEQPPK